MLSLLLSGVLLNSSAALASMPKHEKEEVGKKQSVGPAGVLEEQIKLPRAAKFLDNGKTLSLDNELDFGAVAGYEGLKENTGLNPLLKDLIKGDKVDKIVVTGKLGYMSQNMWKELAASTAQARNLKSLDLNFFYSFADPQDNKTNKEYLMNIFKDSHGLTIRMMDLDKEIAVIKIP